VRVLRIPCGVVVNRVGIGDDRVNDYCHAQNIPLLLEIADDRRIAEAYSRGETIIGAVPAMRSTFAQLFHRVESECHHA
jgi:MinD superfamily P-loop ATPase